MLRGLGCPVGAHIPTAGQGHHGQPQTPAARGWPGIEGLGADPGAVGHEEEQW